MTMSEAQKTPKTPKTPKLPTMPKWGWFVSVIVLLVLVLLIMAYQNWQNFIGSPIAQGSDPKVVVIQKGDNATKVAERLQRADVLDQPDYFVWYLRYVEKHHLLKAGEFSISPTWKPERLVEELLTGKTIQYPVTLIAGQTFKQTLETIEKLPKIQRELDFSDIEGLQKLFGIDKPVSKKYPYANLEGVLLPETYYYQQGDSDKQILLRAFEAMQTELNAAWEQRNEDLPLSTAYEVLILASIVEKETGHAPERAKIAGVFENRLKRKMRLQTDPTIIYGMGERYKGNIRKKDIREKTAYNTYQIDGLPPTPIASPSKEAIWAVAQPEKTDALFFVAKGGGQHYFSKTLAEHNRAVRKYLLSK